MLRSIKSLSDLRPGVHRLLHPAIAYKAAWRILKPEFRSRELLWNKPAILQIILPEDATVVYTLSGGYRTDRMIVAGATDIDYKHIDMDHYRFYSWLKPIEYTHGPTSEPALDMDHNGERSRGLHVCRGIEQARQFIDDYFFKIY